MKKILLSVLATVVVAGILGLSAQTASAEPTSYGQGNCNMKGKSGYTTVKTVNQGNGRIVLMTKKSNGVRRFCATLYRTGKLAGDPGWTYLSLYATRGGSDTKLRGKTEQAPDFEYFAGPRYIVASCVSVVGRVSKTDSYKQSQPTISFRYCA